MRSPRMWRNRKPKLLDPATSARSVKHRHRAGLIAVAIPPPPPRRWRREVMSVETVSLNRSLGGMQGVYKHSSRETGPCMTFSVFVPPPQAYAKLPTVLYLSDLTRTPPSVPAELTP